MDKPKSFRRVLREQYVRDNPKSCPSGYVNWLESLAFLRELEIDRLRAVYWRQLAFLFSLFFSPFLPPVKTCPHCGSHKVEVFDSDNDYCTKCSKWFPALAPVKPKKRKRS